MAKVTWKQFESLTPAERADAMIRKFKKQVDKEGILYEVRRREFFMNAAEKKREKQKRARIRGRK